MRRIILGALGAVLLLPGPGALAQGHAPPGAAPAPAPAAAAGDRGRFPQPIRAGQLAGRLLLEPSMRQTVLGRVVGAAQAPDGAVQVLVDRGGLLGIGTRRVAVPLQATALLGEFLVLMDIDRTAFAALPEAPAALTPLPTDRILHVGLTKN